MNDKISIIILTNGHENELESSIYSASRQPLDNKELIIVSSTDNEELRKRSDNGEFKFYVKLAEKLVDLREYALKKSTGNYVYFIDAGDMISDEKLVDLYEKLTTQKADIVVDDIMKLKDGYFRFNSEDKTAVRQVVFNNYLLFLRRFPTFRKLAGILIKKSLFEQVDASVLSAPSQELFVKLFLVSSKTIYVHNNSYIWRESDEHQLPEFEWSMNHLSTLNELVKKNQEDGYQAKIPKKISVAISVDDNTEKRIDTLIYSIYKNTNQLVDIYIIYNKISKSSLQLFNKLAEIFKDKLKIFPTKIPKKIENLLQKISLEGNHLPISAFYRIFLPELLPNLDRILYLDADTLVINDLNPLWQTDLQGAFIGCVPDLAVAVVNSWGEQLLGPEKDNYFNSGVLLLDLNLFRKYSINLYFYQFILETTYFYVLGDQDALNLYFKNAVKLLDIKFNYVFKLLSTMPKNLEDVTILHFLGPHKPWNIWNEIPDEQMVAIRMYRKYRYELYQNKNITEPRISVIVTVQNNITGIRKNLESLLIQDYNNLEIIVIDGGSTDGAYEIIEQMVQYYPNIKYKKAFLNERMKQISLGLQMATGKYIYFLNGQEYVANDNLFTKLMAYKDKYQADIVSTNSGYYVLHEGVYRAYETNDKVIDFSDKTPQELLAMPTKKFKFISGNLINRSLTDNLNSKSDEQDNLIQILVQAKRIIYWDNNAWIKVEK